MIALLTLLLVVTFSVLINRIATHAFMLTGLSRDVAQFQARSVTTGTGFTTSESEHITGNPARRRIALALMLVQNAGLVTIISTFILSFVNPGTPAELLRRALLLIAGLAVLAYLTKSERVRRMLEHLIERALKRYTDLEVRDYDALLHLHEGFKILRFEVEEGTWLAGQTLRELDLAKEGVAVLTINRTDDTPVCIPRGEYRIHAGDELVLYAKAEAMEELKNRRAGASGEAAHRQAKGEHEQALRRQDADQYAYEEERQAESPAQA